MILLLEILVAIVLAFIIVFLLIFTLYLSDERRSDFYAGMMCGVIIIILSIVEIKMICNTLKEDKPNAIDVYRGNTEIEIHSINNIPQDTVVVWKVDKQK